MASITLNQTEVSSNWSTTSKILMAKGRRENVQATDGPISEHFHLVPKTERSSAQGLREIHLHSVQSIWQYKSYLHSSSCW